MGFYDDVLSRAVDEMKEKHRHDAVDVFARCLAEGIDQLRELGEIPEGCEAELVVVPIPSRRSAIRSRSLDHMAVIGQSMARILAQSDPTQKVHCSDVLTMGRGAKDSASLGATQRFANSRNYMVLRPGELAELKAMVKGKMCVVLIDDVCTTGASLHWAVGLLHRAGISVSAGIVLASAQG